MFADCRNQLSSIFFIMFKTDAEKPAGGPHQIGQFELQAAWRIKSGGAAEAGGIAWAGMTTRSPSRT
jgi:hypothetical protein